MLPELAYSTAVRICNNCKEGMAIKDKGGIVTSIYMENQRAKSVYESQFRKNLSTKYNP
jgi:hypothetical protein